MVWCCAVAVAVAVWANGGEREAKYPKSFNNDFVTELCCLKIARKALKYIDTVHVVSPLCVLQVQAQVHFEYCSSYVPRCIYINIDSASSLCARVYLWEDAWLCVGERVGVLMV